METTYVRDDWTADPPEKWAVHSIHLVATFLFISPPDAAEDTVTELWVRGTPTTEAELREALDLFRASPRSKYTFYTREGMSGNRTRLGGICHVKTSSGRYFGFWAYGAGFPAETRPMCEAYPL